MQAKGNEVFNLLRGSGLKYDDGGNIGDDGEHADPCVWQAPHKVCPRFCFLGEGDIRIVIFLIFF